jgi:2,3-bisphosphoglycerate-dependent phosphoglycerate mutase
MTDEEFFTGENHYNLPMFVAVIFLRSFSEGSMSKLILMRHGLSAWNEKNLFTGWVDIPLSEAGIRESIEGGQKISHWPIDIIFTSTLIRSHMTLALAMLQHASQKVPVFLHPGQGKLEEWGRIYSEEVKRQTIPVYCAWELNERMYGQLQGLNKSEMAKKYGPEQVQIWRRSFDVAPPGGESLEMTAQRAWPFFTKEILPRLHRGENILICAHGNSLRSIVMHLDQLSKEEVVNLELPTGKPLVYQCEGGAITPDRTV